MPSFDQLTTGHRAVITRIDGQGVLRRRSLTPAAEIETVNIMPRTENLILMVNMSEADWLGAEEEEEEEEESITDLENAWGRLRPVQDQPAGAIWPRWVLYQVALTSLLAWATAVIVFQGGLPLRVG